MKNELASGSGTASSFSCRSAIGRGRGLMGISGSSSSSSPTMWRRVDSKLYSAVTHLLISGIHVTVLQRRERKKTNKANEIKTVSY